MRTIRMIKIFTFIIGVFAVLMLAVPGYSWAGQHVRGAEGYCNHNYHNNLQGYHHNNHKYYDGHRYYGNGNWKGYHRAYNHPYHYRNPHHAPVVPRGFPFFARGFSIHIGP